MTEFAYRLALQNRLEAVNQLKNLPYNKNTLPLFKQWIIQYQQACKIIKKHDKG